MRETKKKNEDEMALEEFMNDMRGFSKLYGGKIDLNSEDGRVLHEIDE